MKLDTDKELVYLGDNCCISSQWIPDHTPTGLYDYNGTPLLTGHIATLRGCSASEVVVGINMKGKVFIGFESRHGSSVGWDIDQEMINTKHLTIIGDIR
ncbi:MAG: hypothetical protein K0R54_684 [Clostridiaceae bacterium]|jgi:hypothetical protein|nr:hypothetical protein [Clostridiaceae bacterium]